ncbi:methyltransferase domain-containing protein [Ramlibacter sp. PS3R-8]|uniref:class I SAM-dependent methyltransferase n=1 Tax=Ramlibacter sp. PS3R-8 TaxID=3133437 RepID=UPI003099317E
MQYPTGPGRRPDASRARAQYRGRAARYDAELAPFEPLRREALDLLELHAGDTVLDVGCGTGLSFDGLKRKVGTGGHIVGIDPSPEMLAQARVRIALHHWTGITLLPATAAEAPLNGSADAAMFHFTHDVLRDPQALDHVFAHLKPGAQVVATGLQWGPPWLPLTNAFVLGAALYSVTSMAGLARPWDLLAARLTGVRLHSMPWVGLYVVSGRAAVT